MLKNTRNARDAAFHTSIQRPSAITSQFTIHCKSATTCRFRRQSNKQWSLVSPTGRRTFNETGNIQTGKLLLFCKIYRCCTLSSPERKTVHSLSCTLCTHFKTYSRTLYLRHLCSLMGSNNMYFL